MNEDGLEERIRSPGYTPKARELTRLFGLLSEDDEEVARHAVRALARAGLTASRLAVEAFDAARPPLRSRLVELVERVARTTRDPSLARWVLDRLDDADEKTRRRAISALGKLGETSAEPRLLARWALSPGVPEMKSLALALGNLGGEAALRELTKIRTEDAELSRVTGEACLKIESRILRRVASTIDPDRAPERPLRVLLHVRAGLEDVLQDELRDMPGRPPSRAVGPGRVEVTWTAPLAGLFRARTFLHFGFPLAPREVPGGDVSAAVVAALTSEPAWEIFQAFTRGPVRYRLEWADAGRKRGATFRVAERVLAERPGLVNDATSAPWEVVVSERRTGRGPRVFVELWPRALVDPRFAYRKRSVPASSHPTIAAALARIASAVPDDVVWDPFVGAGAELVERARLGPYAELIGTDVDPRALAAAQENLRAAGVARYRLVQADGRSFDPGSAPSLVLTNPPFGRRVLERDAIFPLLDAVLANAARRLRPGGRVVWVSPLPEQTAAAARSRGLSVRLRLPVDLGGPRGEIQLLVRGRDSR